MRLLLATVPALLALAGSPACIHEERPPPAGDARAPAAQGGKPGLNLGDVPGTPSGPCGEQSIPAVTTAPPNLSFIIDHSGSMGDVLKGNGFSKYENARIALSEVLRKVGHRVNYGAAIFPGLDGRTGCEAGVELIRVGPGDPPSYARSGVAGPILRDLLQRLQIADVSGGTPIAATLTAMLPRLAALEGETFVVLVTDGAPNCNAELTCSASGCIPNIEGLSSGGLDCRKDVNCCAPSEQRPGAQLSCIDDDASVAAVGALAAAGISTFVVGMPGSEPYEDLLNAMAEAGGTARDALPRYYPVADTEELSASLKAIAASVAISCDLPLDYEPPDPDYVNVYFDGELVEYDAVDGWEWTADGHVAIRGGACRQLSEGDVLEVQILAGCKTQVK